MFAMNNAQMQAWSKQRELGFRAYFFSKAKFALAYAIFIGVYYTFKYSDLDSYNITMLVFSFAYLFILLSFSLIGWKVNENQFKKHSNN